MARRRANSDQLHELYIRDNGICHYCKKHCTAKINRPTSRTRDHVIPYSRGGACKLYNMVLACRECNEKRGNILNYCFCNFCQKLITKYCNITFFEMVGGMKVTKRPRIHTSKGKFHTTVGGESDHTFNTLADAMNYIYGKVSA